MATTEPAPAAVRPRPQRSCRTRRSSTSGCTSPAWAATTRSTRSRSSPAARAPTSTTSTASATWTASPACSASTPATAAPSWARPRRAQVAELDFFTVWSYAHPRAIELAAKIASLAPGDLNRVFFTSGGSEAVESAIKLARSYHQHTGNPPQDEVHHPRGRLPRHHARRACRHRHHLPCGPSSSPSCPAATRFRTPTATTGPRTATRSGPPTRSRRRSSTRARRRSPR